MIGTLNVDADLHRLVWSHLTGRTDVEEAGFLFARVPQKNSTTITLTAAAWKPVPPEGFAYRSDAYLELTDSFRASLIKKAHERDSCLVELHSHTGPWPAAFSVSDMIGFREFVPHILWRLRRPYGAVVVAGDTFDGLIWMPGSGSPARLSEITAGDHRFVATKLTSIQELEAS